METGAGDPPREKKRGVMMTVIVIMAVTFTQVDGEFHPPTVQLQAERVCRLFGSGGHQEAVGPLGHEAQGQVLCLGVHGARHDDLQIHAAVVAQHCGLCRGKGQKRCALR